MENSKIEWTDHSWNPWRGCLKVSPGCKACYMYRDQERYGRDPRVVVKASTPTFFAPLKWKEPAKVFTCSWSDWFIDQADEWRDAAWDIVRSTPHLTYQILTKRPENIADRLPHDWGDGWPNVWLGVSVERQDYVWRIYRLAEIPAIVRFVSYEPALGPVDFSEFMDYDGKGWIDWLISGGESGHATGRYKARPHDLNWFRQARDDCQKWGVPYFHKQHGGTRKIDGTWGGRLLDGREWNEFPEPARALEESIDE